MLRDWLQVKGDSAARVFLFQQPGTASPFDSLPEHHRPVLDEQESTAIPGDFRRLRTTDQSVFPRNVSLNHVNAMVGITSPCDGPQSIGHKTSLWKLMFCNRGKGRDLAGKLSELVMVFRTINDAQA